MQNKLPGKVKVLPPSRFVVVVGTVMLTPSHPSSAQPSQLCYRPRLSQLSSVRFSQDGAGYGWNCSYLTLGVGLLKDVEAMVCDIGA